MSISVARQRALRFIEGMLKTRGCTNITTTPAAGQVCAETPDGEYILAVVRGDQEDQLCDLEDVEAPPIVEEEAEEIEEEEEDELFHSESTKVNAGVDYLREIADYAQTHQVSEIIIVTENLSKDALRHLGAWSDELYLVHFTFEETNTHHLTRHILQPLEFRRLTPTEKKTFIQKHPRYRIELPICGHQDPLVKYYGYRPEDLVFVRMAHMQTGEEAYHLRVVAS